MSDKEQFEVISTGAFVAGTRSPGAGKIINLTEEQARYPLIAGEIKRPDPARPLTEEAPGRPGKGKS